MFQRYRREASTMDNKKLRKQLEQLRDEIDRAKNVDDKGKELLLRTKADINSLLSQQNRESLSHPETTSRLEETIAHLEATHPQLALMMTDLLDILSNAGI